MCPRANLFRKKIYRQMLFDGLTGSQHAYVPELQLWLRSLCEQHAKLYWYTVSLTRRLRTLIVLACIIVPEIDTGYPDFFRDYERNIILGILSKGNSLLGSIIASPNSALSSCHHA